MKTSEQLAVELIQSVAVYAKSALSAFLPVAVVQAVAAVGDAALTTQKNRTLS